MSYSTGDIYTDKGGDDYVYIGKKHYNVFVDGIVNELLTDLTDMGGYKLIPTGGLTDSEVTILADAIGIIAGVLGVTRAMVNDRVWILRILGISRYMGSRQLLQVMLKRFPASGYRYPELIFWFIVSYLNENTWGKLIHRGVDISYFSSNDVIVDTTLGFEHNIPLSERGFMSLFDVRVDDIYSFHKHRYSLEELEGTEAVTFMGYIDGNILQLPSILEEQYDDEELNELLGNTDTIMEGISSILEHKDVKYAYILSYYNSRFITDDVFLANILDIVGDNIISYSLYDESSEEWYTVIVDESAYTLYRSRYLNQQGGMLTKVDSIREVEGIVEKVWKFTNAEWIREATYDEESKTVSITII